VSLFLIFYGVPRATQAAIAQAGVKGSYGIEINYAVRMLFKWWAIASAGYWGVIGTIYVILYIATWRLTGQWPQ